MRLGRGIDGDEITADGTLRDGIFPVVSPGILRLGYGSAADGIATEGTFINGTLSAFMVGMSNIGSAIGRVGNVMSGRP